MTKEGSWVAEANRRCHRIGLRNTDSAAELRQGVYMETRLQSNNLIQ